MKQQLVRLGSTGLLLATAGLGLVYARPAAPATAAPEEPTELDELARVHLEQDLMLAERTALMLDAFQEALASWESEGDGE